MECKICGAIVPGDSIYCQKCGRKIDEIGIRPKDVSAFLKEKMDASDTAEIQQYWKTLIDKVGEQKFKSLDIHRSSVEGISLEKLIYEKEGRLHIVCEEPKDYLKLAVAFLINESDCRQTTSNSILRELHNDRMAKLKTAYEQYKRAMSTEDALQRARQLDDASNNCILGMNGLKFEIKSNLELFEKLPKNTIKKLFCGISLQDAETSFAELQEAFPWYGDAVRLLMSIDIQNKEIEKLNMTIGEERDYLEEIKRSKGYERLLEVKADKAEEWKDYVNRLEVDMYFAEKLIETTDNVIIKILEEGHEG